MLRNLVSRPSAGTCREGADETPVKYSKTCRQRCHIDIIHSYRYIIRPHQPTQPTELNQPNQPTSTAFPSHQSRDRSGYGAVHTKFMHVTCVQVFVMKFNQKEAQLKSATLGLCRCVCIRACTRVHYGVSHIHSGQHTRAHMFYFRCCCGADDHAWLPW